MLRSLLIPLLLTFFTTLTPPSAAHLNTSLLNPSHVSRSAECPVIYTNDPPSQPRSISNVTPRIINGDVASLKLARSVVALLRGGLFLCTGTLVSSRWVITAAHCNIGALDTVAFLVRGTTLTSVVEVPVAIAYAPPAYTEGVDNLKENIRNDIAAVWLGTDAPKEAVPLKINMNVTIPVADSFVRIVGFGETAEEQEGATVLDDSRQLQQVDVPTVSSDECDKLYNGGGFFSQSDVNTCAGYIRERRCGACFGDSGGPVLQYDSVDADGEAILVATVQGGLRCGSLDFPGINVRVARFREFFDSVGVDYTSSNSVDPAPGPSSVEATDDDGDDEVEIGAILAIALPVGFVAVITVAFIVVTVTRRRRSAESPFSIAAEANEGGFIGVPLAQDSAGGDFANVVRITPHPIAPPSAGGGDGSVNVATPRQMNAATFPVEYAAEASLLPGSGNAGGVASETVGVRGNEQVNEEWPGKSEAVPSGDVQHDRGPYGQGATLGDAVPFAEDEDVIEKVFDGKE